MDKGNLIHHDDKPKLLRALLLRHRHVNESAHGFPFGARRKFSSYTSLQVTSNPISVFRIKHIFIIIPHPQCHSHSVVVSKKRREKKHCSSMCVVLYSFSRNHFQFSKIHPFFLRQSKEKKL